MHDSLPVREELDFAYLLELMLPLHDTEEFSWLPELFSIIGYESLIKLCKYAGGETIKIPTLDQLSDSIEALQAFYDIYIKHVRTLQDVNPTLYNLVYKIQDIYDSRNCEIQGQ